LLVVDAGLMMMVGDGEGIKRFFLCLLLFFLLLLLHFKDKEEKEYILF